jgi:PTH1 family peptidyl-tRNA hydrolase
MDSILQPPQPGLSPTTDPFLVVGLGNRGRQYAGNRHNVGFMVVSRLAERLGESFSRMELHALVTKAIYQGRRLILAKPQTYMNASGNAVRSLVHFYKIPLCNLLVVYDDVDLPFETLRLRPDGGSGGQKGVQSVIARLGTEEFPRLRIGINRPPGQMEAAEYVLQDFSKAEQETLPIILDRAVDAILTFVVAGLDKAMNLYNN